MDRPRRPPLILLGAAALLAGATVGAGRMPPGVGQLHPPVADARCDPPSSGGDGYVVSGAAGSLVAGLTVRRPPGSADSRLDLEVLGPSGPVAGRRPVLAPGAGGPPLGFSASRTPGCYVARGRLPGGRQLVLRGVDTGAEPPVVLRLPASVRPASVLMRRVRAATLALAAVREVQRIAPRPGARGVMVRLDYDGGVIRERSSAGTTVYVARGWRRYFFWMLPGGISLARRIGAVHRAGHRLAVISGAVPDLGGFIRLLVDPGSGRVREMRFLAAGHVMRSVYAAFRGSRSPSGTVAVADELIPP